MGIQSINSMAPQPFLKALPSYMKASSRQIRAGMQAQRQHVVQNKPIMNSVATAHQAEGSLSMSSGHKVQLLG